MSDTPGDPSADGAEVVRSYERDVVRTARYAMLGVAPEHAQTIWFVLHGYGQLAARFLRHFAGAVPADTCIVAPEGLSRFYIDAPSTDGAHLQRVGATWMTREARELEIRDTLRWLDTLYDDVVTAAVRVRGVVPIIGVLGFSQGVATAMRWIASSVVTPSQVVVWAGGLAHDVDVDALAAKLAHASLTLVAGTTDQFVTDQTREKMLAQMQALVPEVTVLQFEGGHRLDTDTLRIVLAARPHDAHG